VGINAKHGSNKYIDNNAHITDTNYSSMLTINWLWQCIKNRDHDTSALANDRQLLDPNISKIIEANNFESLVSTVLEILGLYLFLVLLSFSQRNVASSLDGCQSDDQSNYRRISRTNWLLFWQTQFIFCENFDWLLYRISLSLRYDQIMHHALQAAWFMHSSIVPFVS